MLNNVIMVGRIASDLVLETKNNRKEIILTLAIQRNIKDENGNGIIDFIPCKLYDQLAETTIQHCQKHNVVGIKGKIQSNEDKSIIVVAERITFLSSNSNHETN